MCMYIQLFIYIYICTYIYIHVFPYVHLHINIYILYTHICIVKSGKNVIYSIFFFIYICMCILNKQCTQLSKCLLLWKHACKITEIYGLILKFHFRYQDLNVREPSPVQMKISKMYENAIEFIYK